MHSKSVIGRVRQVLLALFLSWAICSPSQLRAQDLSNKLVESFVVGNMLWTMFHELAHVLVDEYELPVVGNEENAADQLATLLLIAAHRADPAANSRYVYAAGAGWWLASHEALDSGNLPPLWDTHGLDLQRFYNIVCLMYGADPVSFRDFIEIASMGDTRAQRCATEYERAHRSWDTLLRPYILPETGLRPDRYRGRVMITYQETRDEHFGALRALFLRHSPFLEDVVLRINRVHGFSDYVVVAFRECGEANAYWEPETHSISMCYELAQWFAEISPR